jgi:hypothetical protein
MADRLLFTSRGALIFLYSRFGSLLRLRKVSQNIFAGDRGWRPDLNDIEVESVNQWIQSVNGGDMSAEMNLDLTPARAVHLPSFSKIRVS